MKILGIESSCDETAAAVLSVANKRDNRKFDILSNVIYSQTKEHLPYGGVVPEIASRAHMEKMPQIVQKALDEANLTYDELDGIACTSGPGLMGGLLMGVMSSKSLSLATGKPLIGVNHLEGHALVAQLTEQTPFPYLLLLVSGGHCQFLHVKSVGNYETLGGTIDDSIGECFDKVAKMMDLPYPGGPEIQKLSQNGNSIAYKFPRPLQYKGLDFSFSGLKTAVRRQIEMCGQLEVSDKSNISASFQQAVADVLSTKVQKALKQVECKHFVLAGGVAANTLLRTQLTNLCVEKGVIFHAPPINLCTDNAVMIAYAGALRLIKGEQSHFDFSTQPRWPLDDLKPPQ